MKNRIKICTKCGLTSLQTKFQPKTTGSYCWECQSKYMKEIRAIRLANPRKITICPICKEIPKIWNCDHNHKTKKFNSWLCNNCNRLMGCVKKLDTLHNAIEYYKRTEGLETTKVNTIPNYLVNHNICTNIPKPHRAIQKI